MMVYVAAIEDRFHQRSGISVGVSSGLETGEDRLRFPIDGRIRA